MELALCLCLRAEGEEIGVPSGARNAGPEVVRCRPCGDATLGEGEILPVILRPVSPNEGTTPNFGDDNAFALVGKVTVGLSAVFASVLVDVRSPCNAVDTECGELSGVMGI